MKELRFVGLKLYQIDDFWSEKSKEKYFNSLTNEIKIQNQLKHPNIVQSFDEIIIDENLRALIFEYCEGSDLSSYLKARKTLPEIEAKAIIRQILSGLNHLASQKSKIIHYDLKPQNLFLHKGQVKIGDFGLSIQICDSQDPDETELRVFGVGTYWYLPPECFDLTAWDIYISNKVDVWSLGVIFYEILYGIKPFGEGFSQDKILKQSIISKANEVKFPDEPRVSLETQDFIRKCLSYHKEDRPDVSHCVQLFDKIDDFEI